MTEKVQKYLSDISKSIALIEEFTVDISNFEDYQRSKKTQSAVERQLSILGEALKYVKKEDVHIEINNTHKIIGFRNRLVHAYDNIDSSIVWAILKRHLPSLKEEIKAIYP